jgi:hypothetical protein
MMIGKIFDTIKIVILGIILLAMVVGGLKAWGWVNTQFAHQQEQHEAELEAARQYKEYNENLVRAHTEVVDSLKAEIEELKRRNSAAMNDLLSDIEKKNEKITNMGETIAQLNDNIRDLRVASDHEYKRGTGDYNEQYFKKVMYRAKDENGNEVEVPIAWAMFFPNREADKQWKTGVYPLEYHSEIIQSEQEDGQWNTYTRVWFENNKDSASKGLEVPVKIESSEFKQVKNEDERFYLWAPHLNLNFDLTLSSDLDTGAAGGLSLSLMGYGRTKNDLTWQFLDFGISTNGDVTYGKITPFKYNIGRHLPLIENSFIGPFFGYSTDGDTMWGVGLSIPF